MNTCTHINIIYTECSFWVKALKFFSHTPWGVCSRWVSSPNFVLGRYWIVLDGSNSFLGIIWVSSSVSSWVSWVSWVPLWVPLHLFSLPHLYLTLSHLYLTLQVTPLLTKIKSHEIIIFHKKNIIWYFSLFNPKTFLIFAQKVQYNTLLDMKIQEVMKLLTRLISWRLQETNWRSWQQSYNKIVRYFMY